MNQELNAEDIGQELGCEGVVSVVAKVEEYCTHEERRITLTNQAKIFGLQAEIAMLHDEERDLVERLRRAPESGELKSGRRKTAYYWIVTVSLAVAAFVFSILALEPFRLGWKSYLYCIGIAIVTPFLVEEAIERWNLRHLAKVLTTLAVIAAFLSLILLSLIRGQLLAHDTAPDAPAVVIDGEHEAPEQKNDFYGETLLPLRLAMMFLGIAIELGAGLALHKAWRTGAVDAEDWKALRNELRERRERMIVLAAEMARLQNEPAVFVARFWRNFYRAMLTHTVRNAMTKLLLLILVLIPFLRMDASAEEKLTIIVALDLTQSVAGRGPDGRTDFEKNVAGVMDLLAHAPASSRITVLSITDKSFTQPYILLSAVVPEDVGYFGERLQAARLQLLRAWKERSAHVEPHFKYTDVVGALALASQIFDQAPATSQKKLVIFSDMRHHSPELDLESGNSVSKFTELKKRSALPTLRLRDVQVYALGVDGAGKSMAYWQSLMTFWTEYLESGGATVRTYSLLREMPNLTAVIGKESSGTGCASFVPKRPPSAALRQSSRGLCLP
jgi:hypothetical protein